MKDYAAFLEDKTHYGEDSGFDPLWAPDFLYDFQRDLVEWATRKGRAAIFADCGLYDRVANEGLPRRRNVREHGPT